MQNKEQELQEVCKLLIQTREKLGDAEEDVEKHKQIIMAQEEEIKRKSDELRIAKQNLKEKTAKLDKTTEIVLVKEDLLGRLTKKISQLDTRHLVTLNQ